MEMAVLPCLSADSLAFTFTEQHGNKSLSQGCVTPISLRGTTSTNKSNSKHKCETDCTKKEKHRPHMVLFTYCTSKSRSEYLDFRL